MTYSIGFRAAPRDALAADLARRLADDYRDGALYRDPDLAATRRPARIPPPLRRFATAALRRLSNRPEAVARALGESLSEPKPGVIFDEPSRAFASGAVELDRRSRMLYDARHVYINGASYRAAGAAAAALRRLADERRLDAHAVRRAGALAQALLREWFEAGWLRAHAPERATGSGTPPRKARGSSTAARDAPRSRGARRLRALAGPEPRRSCP
jgi:50S ribosomal protein L16 3-hydroxylase